MELRHEFTVPVPADEAWRVLLDIERVAPCMPGAAVDAFDGETIKGSVKVKVGPMTVTYRGTAAFRERDEAAHRVVLAADGKEARGQGTARATVTGTLDQHGAGTAAVTTVTVVTDLTVTGRPAQFGRGVMAEVGERIIGRFADCLSGELAAPSAPSAPSAQGAQPAKTTPAGEPAEAAGPLHDYAHPNGDRPSAAGRSDGADTEPLDLLRAAGLPVVKRAAGVAAGIVGFAALLSYLRRHRNPHRPPRGR